MTVITAASTPPITMNGLRTRNRSEMNPTRITAMTLNPQFQLPSPFAFLIENPNTVVR